MPRFRKPSLDPFALSPRIRMLPIIHGSGDFAIVARDELLAEPYDCLAVPLPPSFQEDVEDAVERLPTISAVLQPDANGTSNGFNYVPIDPCQGVIAAIRTAIGERIPRAFIDRETPSFQARHAVFPDPYARSAFGPRPSRPRSCRPYRRPAKANTPSELPGWPVCSEPLSAITSEFSLSVRFWTGRGFAMRTRVESRSRIRSRSSRLWNAMTFTQKHSSFSWASCRSSPLCTTEAGASLHRTIISPSMA